MYFYLIYENEYHFSLLTSTSTLLFPVFDPQYYGILIYKLCSIIIQTLKYTQHS